MLTMAVMLAGALPAYVGMGLRAPFSFVMLEVVSAAAIWTACHAGSQYTADGCDAVQ